jgi:hypothetical protein
MKKNVLGTEENKSLAPCQRVSFKVPIGTYALWITDLENKHQTNQKVQILPQNAVTPGMVKGLCGDGKCDIGEEAGKCCVDCGCPSGRNCTNGVCVKEPKAETCGNGICRGSENAGNCCIDCDCPFGKICNGNACVTNNETASYSKDNTMTYAGAGLVVLGLLFFVARKKPGKKQTNEKNKLGGA